MSFKKPKPSADPIKAFIDAEIERAMADYEGRVSPEAAEEMRRQLEAMLRAHPIVSRWVKQAAPEPQRDASGTVASEADREPAALQPRKVGSGK